MADHKLISKKIFSQPVQRLLIVGFLLIAFVPVSFLAYKLYEEAWNNAWREINEKHRLLAMNMASPITIYVNDQKNLLALLASEFARLDDVLSDDNLPALREALDDALQHMEGLGSLSLIRPDGHIHLVAQRDGQKPPTKDNIFSNETCFLKSRDTGSWALSNIKPSPITGEPTLILSQPILQQGDAVNAVLLAELRIDLIEELRRNINFGEKGHSAIVDKTGHVIAHPNPDWMHEIRDLSHLSVVKLMMEGKTGVTEFFSPFVKQQMVAGYTSVPGIGWGVMVPQPKKEVEAQVHALLNSQLRWAGIGLAMALLLAIPLARWITLPINRLANSADELQSNNFYGDIPEIPEYAPKEIKQLDKGFRKVISGLQQSRAEVNQLNESLQVKVEAATKKLRDANTRLEYLAKSDYLTELANRRHFEKTLNQLLTTPENRLDPICIMLIDIDNFKDINDQYGHAAGDAVLVQIAPILKMNMRPNDLVARYGGDEFVIQMNCAAEVGMTRAREIRAYLQNYEFEWQGHKIKTTVSIGLLHPDNRNGSEPIHHNIETLLQKADMAMYNAKKKGRNTVVQIAY
ncbi:MAG: diguanylate cyclase [Gammaproteobacteria bacterium]|jgi:diguanylate cyclase (GGDEF)-like protein